ncbi:MAG: NAD(P)H-dependent oxidoreductase [Thermodesulfobacteriota bacterium]
MERLTTILLALRGWPSLGLFFLLRQHGGPAPAILAGLAYSLAYTLLAMAHGRPSKLDFGLAGFWAMGAASLAGPPATTAGFEARLGLWLNLALFAASYLPLVAGAEPFTMVFARRRTPKELWNTELFRRINELMTIGWAGIFLAGLVANAILAGPAGLAASGLLALGLGLPFTRRFPDWYLARQGQGISPRPGTPAPAPVPRDVSPAPDQERQADAQRLGPIRTALVIFGSPRGQEGFTWKTLDRFLAGLRDGGVAVEVISLADHAIKPCRGCFSCWIKTPGACILTDDMAGILPRLDAADLVIYAQPLYIFSVPGPMKIFLDRCLPRYQPFLVEGPGGLTRHPMRRGERPGRMLVFSVCGFPEREHFQPLLAMFRHMARVSGSRIVGEILRPAAESLRFASSLGPAQRQVWDALYQAGQEVARQGFVRQASEEGIAAPLFPTAGGFRGVANRFWEACLEHGEARRQNRPVPPLETFLQEDRRLFFAGMAASFRPDQARDLTATLRFVLTDQPAGQFSLAIGDGACQLFPGPGPEPTLTVETPFAVWQSISRGEISGQEAYLQGLYQVRGDVGLLTRMREVFGS